MAQAQKWAVVRAYAGPSALELLSFPVPSQLRDDDVLVRVLATTATYTDQMILAGTYRPLPQLPCTPGYDLVGVVEAVGARVAAVAVGDRVASMPQAGCCATHVVLPEKLVLKVRADVAPERAVAVVLTGVTAYQLLHRARGVAPLTAASRLLVHGVGGGTGAMLVKLALIAGVPATRIFGTCSAKSMGVARDLGIRAWDYSADDSDWAAGVLAATDGAGVDLVLDAVVLNGYLAKGLRCLRKGGAYVAYGVTNSAEAGSLSIAAAIGAFSSIGLQESLWSCVDGKRATFFNVADERDKRPDHFAADLRLLIDLVAAGTLDPVVGKVWRFAEAKLALEGIAANAHTGKQVITVGSA